jgi:hypothetical protein
MSNALNLNIEKIVVDTQTQTAQFYTGTGECHQLPVVIVSSEEDSDAAIWCADTLYISESLLQEWCTTPDRYLTLIGGSV